MINIGIGVAWAKSLYSVANNIIANFRARVLSYPNSIFEAGPCLDATLEELNAVGLLDDASLIVTPNAYNEGVLYDVIPNTPLGDMDVVRATTATRVNSAGLIEVVPRNLAKYSEQFDNGDWIKASGASITANSVIAPNGTMTADTLNVAVATYSGIYQNLGSLSGQNTISIYAKKGTKDFLYFINLQGSTTAVWFNISNGTLGTVSSGYTATITDVGNSWYRCTLSQSVSVPSYFQLGLSDSDGSVTPTSTGTAYIWGAQLNSGSTATEYFPTTTRLNIPRIDYTNGSCPSLLVEPQRTNLLTYSEQFNNAAWSKLRSTITVNATTSPDGTQNADKIVENTDNNSHGIDSPSVSVTSGTSYTASVFAKASERRYIFLALNYTAFTSGNGVCFDLQTGTIAATGTGSSSAGTITNFGNGWYRCTITLIATATSSSVALPAIYMGNAVSSNLPAYPGDGTSGLFIWGAQTEVGSYATSYIPTVASSVTRNADVISKTGVSSLIGQTEGTIFVEANLSVNASERRIITVSNGTESQRIMFWTDGTILYANFNNLSVTIGTFPIGIAKMALGYTISGGSTTYSIKLNNNTLIIGTSATAPNPLNSINIGSTTGLGLILNDRINSVQLYKTRLTDEQLILLTGDLYNSYAEMANSLNYILE